MVTVRTFKVHFLHKSCWGNFFRPKQRKRSKETLIIPTQFQAEKPTVDGLARFETHLDVVNGKLAWRECVALKFFAVLEMARPLLLKKKARKDLAA